MSYKKPDGLLLAKPIKRIEPKSSFLKKLEATQYKATHKLWEPEEKKAVNVSYADFVKGRKP